MQAQEPARFQKAYGLDSSETASDVVQLPDGGFMLVGTTSSSISAGGSDIYVVRTDAQGELQWARSYGGGGNEVFGGIATTSDGGIVVAGSSSSWASPDSIEPYLLKIDAAGDPVWSSTYGTMGGFNGIASTPDGGFIMVGSDSATADGAWGDVLVVRVNADGDTLWTRLFDAPSQLTRVDRVLVTSDGDYIIGGGVSTIFFGMSTAIVLKVTQDGTLSWSNRYSFLWANDLSVTTDDDLLVLGPITDQFSFFPSVMRISAAGIPLEERYYYPEFFRSIYRSSMHVFDDNSVAICGNNSILRTDPTGDVLWAKDRMPGPYFLEMEDILVATDGDLLITGWLADTVDLNNDALLIKVEDDMDGCEMDPITATVASSGPSSSTLLPLALSAWTGQIDEVVTQVASGANSTDLCIGAGLPEVPGPGSFNVSIESSALQVSNATVGERYTLFDGMGRALREGRVPADRFSIDLADVPSGAYSLSIAGKDHTQAKRFVWAAY